MGFLKALVIVIFLLLLVLLITYAWMSRWLKKKSSANHIEEARALYPPTLPADTEVIYVKQQKTQPLKWESKVPGSKFQTQPLNHQATSSLSGQYTYAEKPPELVSPDAQTDWQGKPVTQQEFSTNSIERSEFEKTIKTLTENLNKIRAEIGSKGPTPEQVTQEIRLFCTTHRIGFTQKRGIRQILCLIGSHLLGGEFPYGYDWFFCCDCHRFWPFAQETGGIVNNCLSCERRIARRYLCDRCRVLSIESDSEKKQKEYVINAKGISPLCPGCLLQVPSNVWQHECPKLKVSFITARQQCSFCNKTRLSYEDTSGLF